MNSVVNKDVRYALSDGTDEDEINLVDLIGILLDYKWLIITLTAIVFASGLLYIFISTPIYRADALIQVEEKSSGLGDIDLAELFEGDTSVNAEIEILRSRLVLDTVVENLKLDIVVKPNYFPILGAALARRAEGKAQKIIRVDSLEMPGHLLGEELKLSAGLDGGFILSDPDEETLLSGVVGETSSIVSEDEETSIFVSQLNADVNDDFVLTKLPRLRAIDDLRDRLSITEKGKGSGILALSLEGDDPSEASATLNEIANIYVRKNVERKSAEAEKTLEFLDEQLPVVRQDMEAAELALNNYRLEKGSIDLPLETQAILETIVAIEGQVSELERERERVTQSFTSAHPIVIALDRQIAGLNSELEELNDQVRELPSTQQEVLRLVRDTQVNTELYTSLLNTAQELRVVKAGTVGNVRVVDFAVVPYRPVKPNKPLVLLLSLLLGSFVGVGAALVTRTLGAGVDDPDLIEKRLNIPVYATIAHSRRQDKLYKKLQSKDVDRAVLAIDCPDDVSIEAIRNLTTALHFGSMDAKNNCVLVAGPSPTVGKSFVSVNLAVVLASNDKNVLLVDCDMRRGHLHEYLGLSRDDGLSDFISGQIPIGQALHQTSVSGLSLIPTGKIPPNPAELLLHQRFANCLSVLAPRFDHVVVDSPPVLAATDATIIGQMAGATLLVLKSGSHHMREIELAAKRLRQSGVNLRGVIINDVDISSRRFGAGRYNYQYSYSQ